MAKRPEIEQLLQHRDFLRALAGSLVSDPGTQEDLVSDAMEEAVLRPPRHGTLRPWLARVLRNRAKNRKRQATRRQRREREAARPEGLPSAADVAERFELSERLTEKVQQLPDPYREVLLFRYYENLAPRAIAESLDIPVETVKTRLGRALELLRQRLDQDHGSREKWLTALAPLALPSLPTTGISVAAGGTILMSMKTLAPLVLVPLIGLLAWYGLAGDGSSHEGETQQGATLAKTASTLSPATRRFTKSGTHGRRQVLENVKDAAADPARFQGKVVASNGQPIEDAIVIALDAERSLENGPPAFLEKLDRWKRRFRKIEREIMDEQSPPALTRTDAKGRYSLLLAKNAVQVLAWSETHGLEVKTVPDLKACLGVIAMRDRCRIVCKVRDEKDQPLANLWVQIYLTNPTRTFLNVMTDTAGRCQSPPLDLGTYLVFANKNGYKNGSVEVRATSARVSCLVRLERRPETSFLLSDEEQIPWTAKRIAAATSMQAPADILVHLTRVRIPYLETIGRLYFGKNRLKYDGATGRVTGRLDDRRARYLSVWQNRLLVGETILVDEPPARIPIRISFEHEEILIEAFTRGGSSDHSGEPCKVELVKAYDLVLGPFAKALTRRTSSGSAKFHVERQSLLAPSYLIATQGATRSRIVKVPPVAEGAKNVRVWLDLHPVIDELHGRIVDTQGRPVEKAKVVIVDRNGDRIVTARAFSGVNTKAGGKFVVKKILAGNALLYVTAKGFAPSVQEIVISKQRNELEPIRLYPGIQKKIVNPQGGMVHVVMLDAAGRMVYSDRLMGTSRGGRTLKVIAPPGQIQIHLYDVITGKRLPDPVKIGK